MAKKEKTKAAKAVKTPEVKVKAKGEVKPVAPVVEVAKVAESSADEKPKSIPIVPAAPVVQVAPDVPKSTCYRIGEGKALTTKRGIKADGDEIKVDDLTGGQEAINTFLRSGHITRG